MDNKFEYMFSILYEYLRREFNNEQDLFYRKIIRIFFELSPINSKNTNRNSLYFSEKRVVYRYIETYLNYNNFLLNSNSLYIEEIIRKILKIR